MDFEIHWATAAGHDLKSIVDYWERQGLVEMADALGPLMRKIDFISSSPFSGDVLEKSGSHEFRMTPAGSYRIYFEVDPDEMVVTIQSLRHVRQQDPEFSE